ncbi:haloacid dehalogenase-like hydrolase domain-containing protein 2, partial [Reticulomyxa filosa]
YHFGYDTDTINLLEFGMSSLKTNHLPIRAIQQCESFFEKLHAKRLPAHVKSDEQSSLQTTVRPLCSKVFLIGSAIHYVVCGLLRDDEHKVVHLVYIDPQNYDILHRSGTYLLEKIIADMKFTTWIQMGWQRADMEKLAFDSLTGIQSAIDMIAQSIVHYNDLYFARKQLLRLNLIEGFLHTFDIHVLTPMANKITSLITPPLNEGNKINEEKKEANDNPTDGLFVGVAIHHQIEKNIKWLDNKEEHFSALVDSLTKKFHMCIDYTLDVIETLTLSSSTEAIKLKKEFYQFGARLIEHWSQNYYPAGIIDTNISTMLSRLQPHIPSEVLLLLEQWNKFMALFSTEQYRLLMEVQNDSFWLRFATSFLVLTFVCQHSIRSLKLHQKNSSHIKFAFQFIVAYFLNKMKIILAIFSFFVSFAGNIAKQIITIGHFAYNKMVDRCKSLKKEYVSTLGKGVFFLIIYHPKNGDTPTKDAITALKKLQKSGVACCFLTNNSKESTKKLVYKLQNVIGFDIHPSQIVSASSATRRLIETEKLSKPFLLISEEAKEEFEPYVGRQEKILSENNFECKSIELANEFDSVIVGFSKKDFCFEKMNWAFRILHYNKNAQLYAINLSRYLNEESESSQTKDKSTSLNSISVGAFVKALEFSTNKKAHLIGKPSKVFFQTGTLQRNKINYMLHAHICYIFLNTSFNKQQTQIHGRNDKKTFFLTKD